MTLRSPAIVLLAILSVASIARAESPLFPFVIDYGAPDNITNLSQWLDRPAGKHGFVRAEHGQLVTDAGRIRFWATNLCFDACFPSHDEAEQVAARLARLGINCVRMHHMDNHSIWGNSPNKLTIDPARLELLDYLIYQLKQHGIYTNINLHVSRTFGAREGFVAEGDLPKYDKGLDNFEPRMIQLQRKYARDLLTHVNPYTKTRYADEPAIAFVEINNENALYIMWQWGKLDKMPDPYATTFRKLWNAWLRKKYGNTDTLRASWKTGEYPLGSQMFRHSDFTGSEPAGWSLEADDDAQARWSIQPDGPQGHRFLRLVVHHDGRVSWHPQFYQAGIPLDKDKPYTLGFLARADHPHQIIANCRMAHDPWSDLGLSAAADLTTDWKPYQFTFVANRDESNARVGFTDFDPGTYEFADLTLRPGGVVGLQPDQRLEDDGVAVLVRRGSNATIAARQDFIDFICDTEQDYWWGMDRFLKKDLGVHSLVCGTQLAYGPTYAQAGLDYVDDHAYWQHPHFPHRPWDSNDWFIQNIAMVNHPGGTLAGLANRRVDGMAYTVSEYNHPAPNSYSAEGFPMIAAFGAFQGWSGVYSFCYSGNSDFQPQRITNFFDIKSETAKLAHMPACAAMLVRGDVAKAKQTVVVNVSREDERRELARLADPWAFSCTLFGLDRRLCLLHAVGMRLTEQPDPKPPTGPGDVKRFVSDTEEICWDVTEDDAGYFTVNTPCSKLFTGFVRGRTFPLSDVVLKIGPTRLDWATVSMTCIDGQGFDQPGRILLALTGWTQNRDMNLQSLGDDRVTLGRNWGTDPVLCEGIPAEILLPRPSQNVHLYPLDESGNRREPIPCQSRDDKTALLVGPEHKTIWYEIEIH